MSAPATASSTGSPAAGTARTAHAAGHRAGASNAAGGSAVFSNLLDLLSAATGESLLDPLATGGTDPQPGLGASTGKRGRHTKAGEDGTTAATPPDGGDNPLANLLAWPGPAAALSGSSASAPAASGTPGTGQASTGAIAGLATETSPSTPNAADPAAAAAAAAASGDGSGTPLPAGMTLLDQPVEADAQTLAALRSAAPTEGEATPDPASRSDAAAGKPSETLQGATATRNTPPGTVPQNAPANWRSTAGMGQPSTAQQVHAQFAAQVNAQAHAQASVETRAATVRSTVALDERFSATTSTTTATAAAAPAAAVNPAGHPSAGASADGGAGQPGPGGDTASPAPVDKPASESDTASAFDLRTGDDPAVDGGTWNTHGLRHASLRVGEKGEDAIDIRLSLAGDALNVDFRTDQADIRASLQQHAGDSLSDLLQRSGIQLGDVSVGAQHPGQDQGQHPSGQPSAPDVRGTASSRTEATGSATQDPPRAPTRPRSDGSRPVDLFV